MTRAALYARYSSDLQSDASIEDQIAVCRAEAERRGLTVAEIYTDAAISGATMQRPGLRSLIEDARAGRFEVILAEALDRISRGQADVAWIFERLAHAGVPIVTLSEGEISELHVGLKGTMNALFLKDLATKTRRGQRGRAIAGKAPGGLSYGYRVVRRLDDRGELVRGERAIDPDQAAVVVEIFTRYAAGESPREIVHDLNRRGVPAPRGDSWRVSTVVGHASRRNGVLHNPLYRGQLVYNRVRMVKDPDTGKRISRVNPVAEQVAAEVPELRIVPEALWQAAQARRRALGSQPLRRRQPARRLLSGLLACGVCGGQMVIAKRDAYGCTAHRDRGTCGNGRTIPAAEAEARVLEALKSKMLTPERVELFVAEYQAERRRLQQETARRRRAEEKRLGDVDGRIRRYVQAIGDGTDSPAMRRELMELEAERARLAAARAPEKPVERLVPNLAALYRDTVARLQAALAARQEGEDRQDLLAVRSLIEKVVVSPGPGRQAPCEMELHGSLATLLAGVAPEEHRANAGETRGVTVVAGEGVRRRPPSFTAAA